MCARELPYYGDVRAGRAQERRCFLDWLAGPAGDGAALLYVSGRSGSGKSAVLAEWADLGRAAGRVVVVGLPDGAPPAGAAGGAALCFLDLPPESGKAAVLLRDAGVALGRGWAMVSAGRLRPEFVCAAAGVPESAFQALTLGNLSPDAAADWLRAGGLNQPAHVAEVLALTAGNPAALHAAARILRAAGGGPLEGLPEWPLARRGLAARVLAEVPPRLHETLDACSVVYRFDQGTLAAVGGPRATAAFGHLCELSCVAPLREGLTLQPEARRILGADLRWRHPERWHTLRERARAHLRQRFHSAAAGERLDLIADQVFLVEQPEVQALVFGDEAPEAVRISPADRDVWESVVALWRDWCLRLGWERLPPGEGEALRRTLGHPGTQLRVARDRGGGVVGFSTVVPVCRDSLHVLRQLPASAELLEAFLSRRPLAELPVTARAGGAYFIHHLVAVGDQPGAARGALLRDVLGLLALGGTYLALTGLPEYQGLWAALGFTRVPLVRGVGPGSDRPVEGFVLDLSHCGSEAWLAAVQSGVPLRSTPEPDWTDRALQEALARWHDDARLGASALVRQLRLGNGGPPLSDLAAVRREVIAAFDRVRTAAGATERAAYQALELAYLTPRPGLGHRHAAAQLGVSRSTFYRLVRRAVHGLGQELLRRDSGG